MKPAPEAIPITACPLCASPVRGVDPARTCDACHAAGAPARVTTEPARIIVEAVVE